MTNIPTIWIEKCRENAHLPQYAHEGDAGMDLYCAEDVMIAPGDTVLVKTGIKMSIPFGYEVQIRPRSGVSLHTPLRIPNAPGTIDCGYLDEICVIMQNCSHMHTKNDAPLFLNSKGNISGTYLIRVGDRIAQAVVAPVIHPNLIEIEDIKDKGTNRNGGFGSTGI
ncbi:MAG TPA: aminotransferase [Bacillota bacterium]|nr:aminotransferase [Bacillota bacterium]